MKKLLAVVFGVALAVALFSGSYHVRAQRDQSHNAPVPNSGLYSASPPSLGSPHTLITQRFTQGDLATVVGSGFVPIDSVVTFNCTQASGCTIGAEHWLQVGGQSVTGNRWAIVTSIDGTLQNLSPFQGYVPSDGSYATGSYTLMTAVPTGTHTVQEVLYTDSGATAGDYTNNYRLYKGQ